jgi:hypothetical protein
MTRAYNTATTQQNSGGAVAGVTAGKNAVINGGFDIWQRGTSSTANSNAAGTGYTADRWQVHYSGGSMTTSQQATGDTTNLPNVQYCARVQRNSGQTTTQNVIIIHTLETLDSIRFAGQTVTLSFWARAGANYSAASNGLIFSLNSGTGTNQNVLWTFTGSSTVASGTKTLTSTWQRFTATGTVPTSATELGFFIYYTPTGTAGANDYFEITGVQLEVGSVATPFSRNAGTIQGELAACQRYYFRAGGDENYQVLGTGITEGANIICEVRNPTTLRTKPSSMDFSTLMTYDGVTIIATSSAALGLSSRWVSRVTIVPASTPTNFRPYWLFTNNSTSGFIGFSAEL